MPGRRRPRPRDHRLPQDRESVTRTPLRARSNGPKFTRMRGRHCDVADPTVTVLSERHAEYDEIGLRVSSLFDPSLIRP